METTSNFLPRSLARACGCALAFILACPALAEDRILRKEAVVDAPVEKVWWAWTTSEGLASFFSAESKVELKNGGAYDLFMSMKQPDETGRRGAEGCKILSFIPNEMLSFEWGFPPMVMSLRKANAKTHVVLRFEKLGDARTRVRFAQLGWHEGKDWDAGYAYFDHAWSWVMDQLKEKIHGSAADATPVPAPGKSWTDGHVTVTAYESPMKRQDFDMILPVSRSKAWSILATGEGLKKLGGKGAMVELKPGGKYAFWPGANNRVLSFVPYEMLSISGSAPPQFPNVRRGGTWSAYYFEELDDNTTKLHLSCIGWRPGEKEWDDAFDYFLKNNAKFLNSVYAKLAEPKRACIEKNILRQQAVVDGPVDEVWNAFTTKEGVESWMVAHAEIDWRVGGVMRTQYSPDGVIGDPNTIENTILSYEPNRMFSIKAAKPPEKFPFKGALKDMWTVIRLEPIGENQTRVTCTGLGFGDDEESQKLRAFFEKGNGWTLQKLQQKFTPEKSVKGQTTTVSTQDRSTTSAANKSPDAKPSDGN